MTNTFRYDGDQITADKANEITYGTTAPSAPVYGNIWVDTSAAPAFAVKLRSNPIFYDWITVYPRGARTLIYSSSTRTACAASSANSTIIAASGLNVPDSHGLHIDASYEITGSAGAFALGLKFNALTLHDTTSSPIFSATAPASTVEFTLEMDWLIPQHIGMLSRWPAGNAAFSGKTHDHPKPLSAMSPLANITSVTLTGNNTGLYLRRLDISEIRYT